jgi:hypothetical protein
MTRDNYDTQLHSSMIFVQHIPSWNHSLVKCSRSERRAFVHHAKRPPYTLFFNHFGFLPKSPLSQSSLSFLTHCTFPGALLTCSHSISSESLCLDITAICFLTSVSRAFSPPTRYLVTFLIFTAVISDSIDRPSFRSLAMVRAVIANRISLGPSTNDKIALGAASGSSDSQSSSLVYPPFLLAYRSRNDSWPSGRELGNCGLLPNSLGICL